MTPDVAPDNPYLSSIVPSVFIGWEARIALDCVFRDFLVGLKTKPTTKPLLIFLPKGGPSSLLAALLGLLSDGTRKLVCLVEDENLAMLVDNLDMPDRVRKSQQIVIGDLKSLAKTDKDCYGGCVVLAYGVSMPPRSERDHVMYLDDKAHFIAQLCGWSAHVLYLDQPFRDAPDDVLEEMAENAKARNMMCELAVSRDIGVLGTNLRSCGRRVTLVFASLAGSTRDSASCSYVQLFRASGTGSSRFLSQGIPAVIFMTESRAIKFYKDGDAGACCTTDDSPCWFMKKSMYDEWVGQTFETSGPSDEYAMITESRISPNDPDQEEIKQ
jgi:hypothetical protein